MRNLYEEVCCTFSHSLFARVRVVKSLWDYKEGFSWVGGGWRYVVIVVLWWWLHWSVDAACSRQSWTAISNYSVYAVISSQLSVRSFHNPHKNKMSATHPATGAVALWHYEAQLRASRLVFSLQGRLQRCSQPAALQSIPGECWCQSDAEKLKAVEKLSQSQIINNATKCSMRFLSMTARPRNQLSSVQTNAVSLSPPAPAQTRRPAGEIHLTNWLGSQIENWSLFGQNAYSDRTFSPELHHHAQKLCWNWIKELRKSSFLHSWRNFAGE